MERRGQALFSPWTGAWLQEAVISSPLISKRQEPRVGVLPPFDGRLEGRGQAIPFAWTDAWRQENGRSLTFGRATGDKGAGVSPSQPAQQAQDREKGVSPNAVACSDCGYVPPWRILDEADKYPRGNCQLTKLTNAPGAFVRIIVGGKRYDASCVLRCWTDAH